MIWITGAVAVLAIAAHAVSYRWTIEWVDDQVFPVTVKSLVFPANGN